MKVIGIDPSLTSTGIVRAKGKRFTVGGPATHGDTRLAFINQEVERVARLDHPDLAVIERPFVLHNETSLALGMVQGVIRLALVREHVPYALVRPTTLKKYATGDGGADKDAMQRALYRRTGIYERCDDLVDAWWLRHMGLDQVGEPLVEMPKRNREALDVVEWPAALRAAL